MNGEAGAADLHRVFAPADPPVLLGELRKRNRRRIPLDPASKVFNPRTIGHAVYGSTVTVAVAVPFCPASSMTLRTTVYVPATV